MLRLPKILELQLKQDIILANEDQKMKYVMSWERYAREEGEAKGEAKMLLTLLKLKFNNLPAWVEEKVNAATVVQLEQWAEKIFTAQTVEGLFDETFLNSRG
jgi:hypothetical protein